MKKSSKTSKVVMAAIIMAMVFSISACSTSKEVSEKQRVPSPFGIINLQVGIQSEIEGLRNSSIYLAGVYRLKEAVPFLISKLEKEKETDSKLLIALSLYRIGTKECLEAIEKFYDSEKNSDLRKVALSMLYQTELDNSKR